MRGASLSKFFAQFQGGGSNRKGAIPGVTGKRIPGGGRVSPARSVGGFSTNVPFVRPGGGGSAAFRERHRQQVRDAKGQFAGGWGYAWVGLEASNDALYRWADEKQKRVGEAIEQLAKEMETFMKANFSWSRRSPSERARDGDGALPHADTALQAVVVRNEQGYTIYLGHGKTTYYGIWLEVRWGGRYAIITPTAEYFAPQIGAALRTAT